MADTQLVQILSHTRLTGVLDKLGEKGGKKWQKKMVCLVASNQTNPSMLMYFRSASPGYGEKPKATIPLNTGITVQEITRAGRICFLLSTASRPYCFACSDVASRNEWLNGFRDLGVFVSRLTGSTPSDAGAGASSNVWPQGGSASGLQ